MMDGQRKAQLVDKHRYGMHKDNVRDCPDCAVSAFNAAYVATFGYQAAMRELDRSTPEEGTR